MRAIDELNSTFDSVTIDPRLIIFFIGGFAGFGLFVTHKNKGIKILGLLLAVVSLAVAIMLLSLTN